MLACAGWRWQHWMFRQLSRLFVKRVCEVRRRSSREAGKSRQTAGGRREEAGAGGSSRNFKFQIPDSRFKTKRRLRPSAKTKDPTKPKIKAKKNQRPKTKGQRPK